MKKLFISLTLFICSFLFYNFALASMVGNWYVQGSATTKISAKGQKTKTFKNSINDIWIFNSDGSFETEGIGGTWTQKGKKFSITLNIDDIISNFEESLTEDLGTDITIEEIIKMSVTGTEGKNGKMNGTIKIYMNVYSEELGVYGKVNFTGNFKGTLLQPPAYNISGYWKVYHTEKNSTETGPEYLNLSQSGNLLSGEFFTLYDNNWEIYEVFGIISGTNITLILYVDDEVTATGTVSDENMSGTYKTKNKRSGTWRAEITETIPISISGN